MSAKKRIDLASVTVFYINMDKDTEQRSRLEEMLKRRGFTDVRRVRGTPNTNKKVGVANAHKRALISGLNHGGPFIILEDDVIENSFKKYIEIPSNADAYYLGISKWGLQSGKGTRTISVERHDTESFRLYNMLSAHAILYLNMDYVKFLLKSVDFYIKIRTNQDKGRAETMKYWNIYGAKNPLYAQDGKYYEHTCFTLPGESAVPSSRVFLVNNSR